MIATASRRTMVAKQADRALAGLYGFDAFSPAQIAERVGAVALVYRLIYRHAA
jgi:hypothetical protein